MNNQTRKLLWSLLFCCLSLNTMSMQQTAENKFFRKLSLIPIKPESLGIRAKAASKPYIALLQKIATFLHFQNRLLFRLNKMKKKSIFKISESKTLKESCSELPTYLKEHGEEHEAMVKAYIFCKYIDLKLMKINIPAMGDLAPYNIIEQLTQYVKQAMAFIANLPKREELIAQGNQLNAKISEILDFYRTPEIRLAFDDQYTEIIRVLRRSIDFAARSRNPIDYSDHLLDLYYPTPHNPYEYELIDSLLTEQARMIIIANKEEDTDDFAEDDESVEDTQTASVKAAPAPAPATPSAETKSSKKTKKSKKQKLQVDHGVPNQYSVKHASEKTEHQTVVIDDIDNGLTISLDLSDQPESVSATTSATPASYYSKEIKEWFGDAYNQLKKRGQHQGKLPKREWIIQQNRFCPLVDRYIRAIGRKYLEITNPHPESKKPTTFITCLDLFDENSTQALSEQERWGNLAKQFGINHKTLSLWMSDAERRKHKARIRIDLDGKLTFKNGKSFPCTFVYHIDPSTEQIVLRTIECDYNPLTSLKS